MIPRPRVSVRRGFTLVELLVVIAIIAILMGLLIPAVNSVRESARVMQCRGNIRQLAQATTSFANVSGVMPTAGSTGVFGTPDSPGIGVGGGWLFRILPFVEQQSLYDLGAGLTGVSLADAVTRRVQTPLALYTCANRGSAVFTAPPVVSWTVAHPGVSYSVNPAPSVLARSDYAGCWAGQDERSNAALGRNPWSDSGRMLEEIIDGQSNVFLCGERYLPPDEYRPGPLSSPTNWVTQRRECNNKGWSVGHEGDVYASGAHGTTLYPPLQDTPGTPGCPSPDARWAGRFGSPHAGVPMAMVDGSVRLIAFDIHPPLFQRFCVINDGGSADVLDE